MTRVEPADRQTPQKTRERPGRLRDIGLGIRFAVSGGREGWIRTALTALGVGLGVAVLFVAASVPHMTAARAQRGDDRRVTDFSSGKKVEPGDSTLVWASAYTAFRGETVGGQLLRPDGSHPARPPGVEKVPGPGEMVVSPALRDLLASSDGVLLKPRLDYRVTGTIGDSGLLDPGELFYYAGSSGLTTDNGGTRTVGYGSKAPPDPMNPVLLVLIIIICVVLLVPVAVFIGTAVRFGGERRDRRLAALRLVGADIGMTRRVAAGEAFFGSALGVAAGLGLFLAARPFTGHVHLWSLEAFPSDVVPDPMLAALIVLAVPCAAVVVSLIALRSVTIEPLGVVRNAGSRRRKLWWRLLMPAAGVTVLVTTDRVDTSTEAVNPYPIAIGAMLVLIGLTALLPWLVEAAVARLRGGPVPWQLAARRLQLSSGSAARAVSGITVAVAGAIALQLFFGGIQQDFFRPTGQDTTRADMTMTSARSDAEFAERAMADLGSTRGVAAVIGTVESYVTRPGRIPGGRIRPTTTLVVGTCATLREIARLTSCEDGDTFVSHLPGAGSREQNDWIDQTARPGKPINVNSASEYDGSAPVLWTLPVSSRTVTARRDPTGVTHDGILATPGAIAAGSLKKATTTLSIRVDDRVSDAQEYVRNTAARLDPVMNVATLQNLERDHQYETVQTGLLIGGTATMGLIAASMLVSQIEQLRERRRLLAVLVAFGTRRSTLAWSVLWQTALPVFVGTAVAAAGGLALGVVLLRVVHKTVKDWGVFLPFAGAGAALILVVTVLCLPPLWRMMRPDGLRTE